MGRLNDKTAVITGGTTGIGFEAARQFVAEGAKTVVITGVDKGRLEDAAARLGPNAVAVRADVRSLAELTALAGQVQARAGGRIDILFANAGVGSFAPLEAVDEQFFDYQFDVNVKGVYFTVKAMLPLLGKGSSVILNASSVNGKGLATGSVYFSTKAAVRSLARTFAAELAPKGIRVNSVSPGLVPTPFIGKMGLPQEALDGFAKLYMDATPLGRLGTPEEIGPAVVFLASDEARYITAHDLLVDGGWMSV